MTMIEGIGYVINAVWDMLANSVVFNIDGFNVSPLKLGLTFLIMEIVWKALKKLGVI